MTHFFPSIFQYLHLFVAHHFMRLWLLVLLLAIVGGWLLSALRGEKVGNTEKPGSGKIWGLTDALQMSDWIAILALVLFIGLYIFQLVYGEDFAYYDNDQITDFSATGNSFRPPVWPDEGRFFPLGHQEFNFIRYFTRTAFGYQCFVAVQLVVLLAVLFAVLREVKVTYRTIALAALITAPSFVIPFTGLIYPDRNVIFWLGVLIFCLVQHEQSHGRVYFVGCLIATQFILYYKETVIVFLVVYAVARFLLDTYLEHQRGGFSWRALARENVLPLSMLSIAGIYCLLFVIAVFGYSRFSYVNGLKLNLKTTVAAYFETDWLLPFFIAAVVWRVLRFIRHRGQLDPIWDPLALGAVAYFTSLLAIRMFREYYLALVDVVAFLYLAFLIAPWVRQKPRWRVAVPAIALACMVVHNTGYSALKIIERKTVIQLNRELADFLKAYGSATTGSVGLFFPYADGYRLMELSSYLQYRGLPLSGRKNGHDSERGLVFKAPEEFRNNRCVIYKEYQCTQAAGARGDDLIVILPDDKAPAENLQEWERSSTELLSRESWPANSTREQWIKILHAVAWDYWRRSAPQHLWQLHVFKPST